ncbi:MAG: DUF4476 domain-containing protein [Bacteroidales bacterium]|nr:DUF4476 domain-containing protein [Bacteroidales bacterium]
MKNVFVKIASSVLLLAAFLFLAPSSYAQHHHGQNSGYGFQTSLTVSSSYNSFWLFIDDVLQNQQSVKSIRVENVPEGDHYLRVEIDDIEHHTIGQLVRIGRSSNGFCIERSRNLFGLTIGNAVSRPDLTMSMIVTQHGYNQGDWYGYHPSPQSYVVVPAGMNDTEFNQAIMAIQAETFESNKLNMAKRLVRRNPLSVNQIDRLCRSLEYDHMKLELAKYAYNSCVDPERYFLLVNVFTFDSNKRELEIFIQRQY